MISKLLIDFKGSEGVFFFKPYLENRSQLFVLGNQGSLALYQLEISEDFENLEVKLIEKKDPIFDLSIDDSESLTISSNCIVRA